MKERRQRRRRSSRKLRFAADVFLTLVVLLVIFFAGGLPDLGDETEHFRKAERANLMGPSVILDRFDVPETWMQNGYRRLLIGDTGEAILLYPIHPHGGASLVRREKTDGILLTPAPGLGILQRGGVLPLFLFADDPGAVKAEVTLHLSDTLELELSQVRGPDAPPEERNEDTREAFFLFVLPVPEDPRSELGDRLQMLSETNLYRGGSRHGFPAEIRLYDASGALLETREYIIRSRAADAAART